MNRLAAPLQAQLERVASDWRPLLRRFGESESGRATLAAVDARVGLGATVYPAQVFRALEVTPLAATKVLILGQDPYHGPGQAEGLAFSVPAGQKVPPSLRNIFKELQRDLGLPPPTPGRTSLLPWAQQGVLLLNTSLTVEDGQAGSHSGLGWQALTDAIMRALVECDRGLVFMLWGAHAQARLPAAVLELQRHLVLRSNHPSPLSALRGPEPFLGCGHFDRANRWLQARGEPGLRWQAVAS